MASVRAFFGRKKQQASSFVREKRKEIIENTERRLVESLDDGNRLREEFVATWQENKPTFETKVSVEDGEIVLKTVVNGPTLVGSRDELTAYEMLDEGTSVRRALVSADWTSKTGVRQIASGRGSGVVKAVNPNFAFPGIEAREIEDEVLKQVRESARNKIILGVKESFG